MAVTVVTLNTSLVRGTTAKFNGNLTDMNGQAAIDCYFQYKITGAASWSDTSANKEELTAVGEFSYEISGLTENESYEVRAVAEWDDGGVQNAYGDTETFNAYWVREGSQEDFERGILDGLLVSDNIKLQGYLYKEGHENVTFSEQYLLGSTSYWQKHSDHIFIYTDHVSDGEVGVRMDGTIDLTDIYTIKIRWARLGTHSNQQVSMLGVDTTLEDITVDNHDSVAASIYSRGSTFSEKTDSVDVSALSGDHYLVIIGELSSGASGTCELYVYEVWAEDSSGAKLPFFSTGNRQMPHLITDTSADIAWTATTPIDTTLAIEAQVKSTTAITDEAVGTGDGVETVFTLDHWPANTPTITVNAVAETGFTLGDDRRTITFDTAPADGHAILASYTAVDDPQEDEPEIQELDLDNPAGGTFKLGDGTTWTADIAYDATAATIETALEGLYGAGNVVVAGTKTPYFDDFSAHTVDAAPPIVLGPELWDGQYDERWIDDWEMEFVDADHTRTTKKITVTPGRIYCFAGGNACRVAWVDDSDVWLEAADLDHTADPRYGIAPPLAAGVYYYYSNESGAPPDPSVKQVTSGYVPQWVDDGINYRIRASGSDQELWAELTTDHNLRRMLAWAEGATESVRLRGTLAANQLYPSDGPDNMSIAGLACRVSGARRQETGYVLALRRGGTSGTGGIQIVKYVASSFTGLSSVVSFALAVDTIYHLLFEADGTTLRGKVWADGDPEPAEWMVTTTDSSISAGACGLFYLNTESTSQVYRTGELKEDGGATYEMLSPFTINFDLSVGNSGLVADFTGLT